jgi:uncharacterized protein YndB with AHSA1/START domain
MLSTGSTTDRIEKHITLRAPRARVWRALTQAKEFGDWFGMTLDGPFEAGAVVRGRLTRAGYDHFTVEMRVERVDPEELFSYRWHPYAVDPKIDYSTEPMTLVEFRLADVPGGTQLTVIESGFEHIPAGRRAEAFRMNDGGWGMQVKNIEQYVTQS